MSNEEYMREFKTLYNEYTDKKKELDNKYLKSKTKIGVGDYINVGNESLRVTQRTVIVIDEKPLIMYITADKNGKEIPIYNVQHRMVASSSSTSTTK